jgi:hypothetical protein
VLITSVSTPKTLRWPVDQTSATPMVHHHLDDFFLGTFKAINSALRSQVKRVDERAHTEYTHHIDS